MVPYESCCCVPRNGCRSLPAVFTGATLRERYEALTLGEGPDVAVYPRCLWQFSSSGCSARREPPSSYRWGKERVPRGSFDHPGHRHIGLFRYRICRGDRSILRYSVCCIFQWFMYDDHSTYRSQNLSSTMPPSSCATNPSLLRMNCGDHSENDTFMVERYME